MNSKLYVGNMRLETMETDLRDAFELDPMANHSGEQRRGCRSLMHEHALQWRKPARISRPI